MLIAATAALKRLNEHVSFDHYIWKVLLNLHEQSEVWQSIPSRVFNISHSNEETINVSLIVLVTMRYSEHEVVANRHVEMASCGHRLRIASSGVVLTIFLPKVLEAASKVFDDYFISRAEVVGAVVGQNVRRTGCCAGEELRQAL